MNGPTSASSSSRPSSPPLHAASAVPDGKDQQAQDRPLVLLALPFAGATRLAYNPWIPLLPSGAELIQVELPGRGSRWGEPLADTLADVAESVLEESRDLLVEREYAIFGHSMGALLAFELGLRIQREGLPRPRHVFLSGRGSPDVGDPTAVLPRDMSEAGLVEALRAYGGLPDGILESRPVLDFLLPVIRADLRLVETYVAPSHGRLKADVTLLRGRGDDITAEEMHAWRERVDGEVRYLEFEGGHFFIFESAECVTEALCSALSIRRGVDAVANSGA